MQKIQVEIRDGNRESFSEPVFLESLHDLPMGVKQAVEDFIEAHDGEIANPITASAQPDDDHEGQSS